MTLQILLILNIFLSVYENQKMGENTNKTSIFSRQQDYLRVLTS